MNSSECISLTSSLYSHFVLIVFSWFQPSSSLLFNKCKCSYSLGDNWSLHAIHMTVRIEAFSWKRQKKYMQCDAEILLYLLAAKLSYSLSLYLSLYLSLLGWSLSHAPCLPPHLHDPTSGRTSGSQTLVWAGPSRPIDRNSLLFERKPDINPHMFHTSLWKSHI